MNKRPSSTDTEHDILKMQNDFVLEKHKNSNFQPAAKVVKLNKTVTRAPSSFAQKRGLVKAVEQLPPAPAPPTPPDEIIGDIVERQISVVDTQKTNEDVSGFTVLLGDIVERKSSFQGVSHNSRDSDASGFPKAERIPRSGLQAETPGKSLFSMYRASLAPEPMDDNGGAACSNITLSSKAFGEKSYILNNEMATSIHEENVKQLGSMDRSEIMAERQQLLASLDPELIKFLQSKRAAAAATMPMETISEPTIAEPTDTVNCIENEATLDIMQHPNYKDWPNFDIVQPQKLQWMNDIAANLPPLKPGETFEARFDWKGVLLPYVMSGESDADRELYLHGDDAERPGYTLQELFRLARSNIVQQRISAIGSVAGILNIYSQGFYDTVLELPISKIFFLLRYAFDDNIPAILEITSKALATLLYIESDEVLLDFIYDRSVNFCEPSFAQNGRVGEAPIAKVGLDLSDEFAKINLKKTAPRFETNLQNNDDDDERETLNDFHLAEVDLIDCVLRTNIIQRINYVLFTVRPDNSTVLSCFKLLIRLARNDKTVAESILQHHLMENILTAFLPPIDGIGSDTKFFAQPQHMALKLIRIIAAYGADFCQVLFDLGLADILKNYIFVRSDLSVDLIRLQVEAFRAAKVMVLLSPHSSLFGELSPALMYLLEWCYQFLKFDQSGHVLLRQHASALIAFIGCGRAMSHVAPFGDKLTLCFSKWFHLAGVHGIVELSQNMLLATCLDVCTHYASLFKDFFATYLCAFLQTLTFANICDDLSNESPLLQKCSVRSNKHTPLPDLNAIVMNANAKSAFLFTQKYPLYLLDSIAQLLSVMAAQKPFGHLFGRLSQHYLGDGLLKYVSLLANNGANKSLIGNWFVQNEVMYVVRLLVTNRTALDKGELQKAAFNVSGFLTEHNAGVLVELFECVVFDVSMYTEANGATQTDADRWRDNYQIQMTVDVRRQKTGFNISNHDKVILPANWPYKLLLIMFRADTKRVAVPPSDRVLITACISLTSLQQSNGFDCVSPTEEFLFLMMAFLGKDVCFLDDDIRVLLAVRVQAFFERHRKFTFQLDQQFEGSITFENLYIQFLDHFQATSYCDATFGALVMVPLSQKYALRWRQMVWSEHLSVLRFIQCTEDQLFGFFSDYVEPIETDETMLKYFYQALNTISLAELSIPRRIATHHLRNSKFARALNLK